MFAPSRTAPSTALPSFEAVLGVLPQAFLVLDEIGEIVFRNGAALALVGDEALERVFPGARAGRGAVPAFLSDLDGAPVETFAFELPTGGHVVELRPCARAEPREVVRDELTGLLTRGELLAALALGLRAAEEAGAPGAVVVHVLDLDRFKIVNDTLGHAVGDLLLRKVAGRLQSACREGDVIARIGGDEFVVVQQGVSDLTDAEALAARLVDLVGRTYVVRGHTINVGASIGFAQAGGGVPAEALVRNADLALYEAKRTGRGRFRQFAPGMDEALRERRELEIDLRRALALRQFELHFQPLVQLHDDSVSGFEALIRWEHPKRGRVAPLSFIPLAEESGLIVPIGEWVLRTACRAAAGWAGGLCVAVNVSPLQFRVPGLVETVMSALEAAGLPPERLELEITEGALLDNTDEVLATLHTLRDLGVRISMDDFGTGYSSLSYLQRFPFHKIKIDRSFVQGAHDDEESLAILKAITRLGVDLGMEITAEGVETARQLSAMRAERCTHVQGYFTGRPLPLEGLGPFLASASLTQAL